MAEVHAGDRVRIVREEVISDNYYPLKKVTYEQQRRSGKDSGGRKEETREVYDCASGAAVLLYNRERRTVVLTRQFRVGARISAYAGGSDGFLLEAAAGMLDGAPPEERAKLEAREETGYDVDRLDPVMQLFVNPGSTTERIFLFVAEYDPARRCGRGGGLAEEGEDIEVCELDFDDALAMIETGGINDAKTVLLLLHLERKVLGRHEAS
jgi:nudix-type nucleoside diphosphatase (YffH/AdpP family)